MEDEIRSACKDDNANQLEQIENPLPSDCNEIETKKGNYLLLDVNEVEAIKQYTGFGNVRMNMLFNSDIDSVIPRLQHWARADENIEKFLDKDVVDNIINLYSALLKSYDYHNSDADVQEHPSYLYRGSTGDHHSDGFKSFTETQAMAESFGNTTFIIPFPKDIPYLSKEDIFNYAPHTSRREETEYLFSPFCDIKPIDSKDPFSNSSTYVLSKKEFLSSKDNLPSDINENLKIMAEDIFRYKKNLRDIERFERYKVFDDDYQKILSEANKIRESYKKTSEEVLNYIISKCAELNKTHVVNEKQKQ